MAQLQGRKRLLAVAGFLVLAGLILWQVSFKGGFEPSGTEQTILLFALSTLVSLTFLVFAFILARNFIKLYVERRANQLGSKFKTKLISGALALSLLPVSLLFYFSYLLVNRALYRWFNQPFASMEKQVRQVIAKATEFAERETEADALAISRGPMGEAIRSSDYDKIRELLREEAQLQGVTYLAVEINTGSVGFYSEPADNIGPAFMRDISLAERRTRRPLRRQVTSGSDTYAVEILPIDPDRIPYPSGWLIAANKLPEGLTTALEQINKSGEEYEEIYKENKRLRNTYLAAMALVTVLILVASNWVAQFLAKQVTGPIAALAEAAHQVSQGNLDHRIKTQAADELGVLVNVFNDMIGRLEESGAELERRRRETEAILESIPTPVISLARDRRVIRVNPAVERMLGAQRASAPTLRELFTMEELRDVDHLLRRSLRQGLATAQLDITTSKGRASVAMTVSALRGGQRISSDIAYIIVMEDLSDLIHAQQSAAWQEVARRVAHEIKNPLTPIALSAERIRRKLEQMTEASEDPALVAIADCSTLIQQEAGTLKTLVDEFSQMARFPSAQMAPTPLNPIVENAMTVFDGRLDSINVQMDLAPDLPMANVDSEQIKRVIVNLVDNAAEAMEGSLLKELRISTARAGEFVEVAVADTGHGVNSELREKLFLPHFSTKKRGTGLGLAIVSRIVAEHHGTIRVEENVPVGARFILELPV